MKNKIMKKQCSNRSIFDIRLCDAPRKYVCNNYLTPAFTEIFLDKAKCKIVQAVRQSSKTRYICGTAFLNTFIEPNKTIFIGTINDRMAQYIINEIVNLHKEVSYLIYNPITKNTTRCGEHILRFKNESIIIVSSIKSETRPQCWDIDLTLLDEFAFVNDNLSAGFIEELFSKRIHIVSTRKNRSLKNTFWYIWMNAMDYRFNEYKRFSIGTKDVPYLNEKILSESKRWLGRTKYEKEFTLRNL